MRVRTSKIEERVDRLLREEWKGDAIEECDRCNFLPRVTLERLSEDLLLRRRNGTTDQYKNSDNHNDAPNQTPSLTLSPKHHIDNRTTTVTKEEIVYLSPDADETLSPDAPPPPILVVGMLVDRRIRPDRSKKRAAEAIRRLSARPSAADMTSPPVRDGTGGGVMAVETSI